MKKLILFLFCLLPFSGIVPAKSINHEKADADARNKIAKSIIEAFAKQDYDAVSQTFHASLKQTLPNEKLQEIWQNLSSQLGNYVEIVSYTPNVVQGYNIVTLRCKFEKDNVSMDVTFNQDDKVVGLYFRA